MELLCASVVASKDRYMNVDVVERVLLPTLQARPTTKRLVRRCFRCFWKVSTQTENDVVLLPHVGTFLDAFRGHEGDSETRHEFVRGLKNLSVGPHEMVLLQAVPDLVAVMFTFMADVRFVTQCLELFQNLCANVEAVGAMAAVVPSVTRALWVHAGVAAVADRAVAVFANLVEAKYPALDSEVVSMTVDAFRRHVTSVEAVTSCVRLFCGLTDQGGALVSLFRDLVPEVQALPADWSANAELHSAVTKFLTRYQT
jgi:hypothetical protein